uniref:V-type proton ATPase subunit C n=1 Tax=Blastobotrys adeninivorans TaxID=409370 RepID=A0A060TDL3_BLAAD
MSLLLLCLPSSAAPAGGDPQTQLEKWLVEKLNVPESSVHPFNLPNFKIGTLDSLIQHSEELAKIDGQFQSIATKAGEILAAVYEGNSSQLSQARKVDGSKTPEEYFESFSWNTSKYRLDKSISDLVELVSREAFALDSDVRNSYNEYQAAKSNLSAVDRRQTGNLSVRSLHDVVRGEHFVQNSEYLRTVLIAVPTPQKKEYLSTYETLVPMVVPRSASVVAEDQEYTLFNTTVFAKYVSEFVSKAREHKWTPREFNYSPELVADMRKEQQVAVQNERRLWAEVVRLARTAHGDIIKAWAHLKAIRVFVESVLRYGLPPNFLTAVIRAPKNVSKAEDILIEKFGYLGGSAFSKDKRGKLKGDSDLSEYGALVDLDYKPFVLYQLEL